MILFSGNTIINIAIIRIEVCFIIFLLYKNFSPIIHSLTANNIQALRIAHLQEKFEKNREAEDA